MSYVVKWYGMVALQKHEQVQSFHK